MELLQWRVRHIERGELGSLEFDFDKQRVLSDVGKAVQLPAGSRLRCVIIDGAIFDAGRMTVEYSHGKLPTYAIGVDSGRTSLRWHVICGPSGRVETFIADEGQRDAVAGWLATWANAN